LQRFAQRFDSQLASIDTDQANFTGTDRFVHLVLNIPADNLPPPEKGSKLKKCGRKERPHIVSADEPVGHCFQKQETCQLRPCVEQVRSGRFCLHDEFILPRKRHTVKKRDPVKCVPVHSIRNRNVCQGFMRWRCVPSTNISVWWGVSS
jgi:hypothetical protein